MKQEKKEDGGGDQTTIYRPGQPAGVVVTGSALS